MLRQTSGRCDPDMMTEAAHTVIMNNYDELARKVSVEDILSKLFSKRVIGMNEKQEIEAGNTPLQKSRKLADCMLRKSGKQFEQFCCILEDTKIFDEIPRTLRSQYEAELAERQRKFEPAEGVCLHICTCMRS